MVMNFPRLTHARSFHMDPPPVPSSPGKSPRKAKKRNKKKTKSHGENIMSELRDEKKEEDPREDSKRVLGEEEFEINIGKV